MQKTVNPIYIIAALVSLFTFLIYLPALKNDFVDFDDSIYVYENPHIRSLNLNFLRLAFLGFYAANYHPLTLLSHAMDYAIWGLDPMGHHLTNIILHALNTFLVVMLIALLLKRANLPDMRILTASAVTGILFGIHPLHVESVAWVSERKDLLYSFFYLLSIIFYIRHASSKSSRGAYVLCLLFFSLSLMSKPMAVTLPAVLLIIDWHPLGRLKKGNIKKLLLEKIPFFALSLTASALTVLAQQSKGALITTGKIPFYARSLVGIKSLAVYLEKIVFPKGLVPFYPYPRHVSLLYPEYLISLLAVAGITTVAVISLKRNRFLPVIWAYYLISLLPVLGIIQAGSQEMADRYMYLPSLGPFLLAGVGAAVLYEKTSQRAVSKIIFFVLGLFVAAALSYSSIKQIRIWRNSLILWNSVLEIKPEAAMAYNVLGGIYMNNGLTDKAEEYFKTAIALKPDFERAHNNLGAIYLLKGMPKKAMEHFIIALHVKPDFEDAHYNLGLAYISTGLTDRAIEHYLKAIALKPDYKEAHYNLGAAYKSKGMTDKAAEHLRHYLALNPGDSNAQRLLYEMTPR